MPGERRESTVQFRRALLTAAPPHLMGRRAWNVTPGESNVDGGQPVSLAIAVTDGCEVRREAKNVKVRFTATQRGVAGPGWTTWPVPVTVDSKVAPARRYPDYKMGVISRRSIDAHSGLPAG